ncbi:Gfo/Idh/MocA family protein [Alicyclobacillus fastidiosus]|uniref:Gfo/Idh/MocA family oxidoreductase n=1 Tax=Alicyclobacillus fastidiosus TaxID=392011 RepID=A0ABV5ABT2_9BACL|nr:Gfo/Idh/MocA family oxidoreductase [Alicyclobacillus fastidiosus]WEH10511.1 Gfo/Idh/MocA family oxidoreductase [Alicyclobacillus fastidiosus]
MTSINVGIIGCGNISAIYLSNLSKFPNVHVSACADIDIERATARAAEFNVDKACSVEELLQDEEIQLVVNLTIPKAHAEVCIRALEAGKHVHVEKPLATDTASARQILDVAKAHNLRVGVAPDTFLGAGLQTTRKVLDDGWIGRPVAATAFMMSHGHERWHPDPAFFYQQGGGPMYDMGPYYLTAFVHLLGPANRVTASTQMSFAERTILSEPKRGEKIQVEVPTHIAGIVDFECGAVATLVTSFDVWHAELPRIEIYGTEGTISVPDPNTFGGPVRVRRYDANEWTEMPLTHGFSENSRGLAVADMADAIMQDRPHRASLEQGLHVLEMMEGFHTASTENRHVELAHQCQRPEPLPVGFSLDQFFSSGKVAILS